jgi:hypothetical protein
MSAAMANKTQMTNDSTTKTIYSVTRSVVFADGTTDGADDGRLVRASSPAAALAALGIAAKPLDEDRFGAKFRSVEVAEFASMFAGPAATHTDYTVRSVKVVEGE